MTARSSDDTRTPTTLRLAREIGPDLQQLRRRLHRIPEIGNQVPLTQQVVLEALEGLDLEIIRGRSLTSVTAVLRGTGEPADGVRQVVLLRGDMDALPVTEEVEVEYVSETRAHARLRARPSHSHPRRRGAGAPRDAGRAGRATSSSCSSPARRVRVAPSR